MTLKKTQKWKGCPPINGKVGTSVRCLGKKVHYTEKESQLLLTEPFLPLPPSRVPARGETLYTVLKLVISLVGDILYKMKQKIQAHSKIAFKHLPAPPRVPT